MSDRLMLGQCEVGIGTKDVVLTLWEYIDRCTLRLGIYAKDSNRVKHGFDLLGMGVSQQLELHLIGENANDPIGAKPYALPFDESHIPAFRPKEVEVDAGWRRPEIRLRFAQRRVPIEYGSGNEEDACTCRF